MSVTNRNKYGIDNFPQDDIVCKIKDLEIAPPHIICVVLTRIALNNAISEQTGDLILQIVKSIMSKEYKDWSSTIRKQLEPVRKGVYNTLVMLYGEKCVYCGSSKNLQIDHIKPISKGGDNDPHNLQLLCRTCNIKKTNKFNEDLWV